MSCLGKVTKSTTKVKLSAFGLSGFTFPVATTMGSVMKGFLGKRLLSIGFLIAMGGVIEFSVGVSSLAGQPSEHCLAKGAAIVVDTGAHRMWLCQAEHRFRDFPVAIGRGGVDKRTQGDKKTPLGDYELGEPRSSEQFSLFIPVGYPTKTQREEGYSGGDIGVHGPPRRWEWLGRLTTWVDWTQGCIAVGSDEAISELAQWVREQKVKRILIQ